MGIVLQCPKRAHLHLCPIARNKKIHFFPFTLFRNEMHMKSADSALTEIYALGYHLFLPPITHEEKKANMDQQKRCKAQNLPSMDSRYRTNRRNGAVERSCQICSSRTFSEVRRKHRTNAGK